MSDEELVEIRELQRLRGEKELTIRTLKAFEREIRKPHSQRELLAAWNMWYHRQAKPLLDRLQTPAGQAEGGPGEF